MPTPAVPSAMRSYRAKAVERTRLPDREEREEALESAGYNVFNLRSWDVYVDLLTDSGTGTMSDEQWAALMRGDEAYAGSRSFEALREAVADVMGFERVVPAHQGRGAENVLYGILLEEGDVCLNNTHFDTTRAHVANQGADPIDCPVPDVWETDVEGPFLGNFDVERGREVVAEVGAENVPAVVLTMTNNSAAGQPVSMENVHETAAFAEEIDATFVVDACRFAENAHFIAEREAGYGDRPLADVARDELAPADAIIMSGKKEALTNVGGFVGVRDDDLFEACKQRAILYEGFPTYGGLAGRDLAAMAVGLREVVEPPLVAERVEQVRTLGELLAEAGLPVIEPVGGHAVYFDAGQLLDGVPAERFPGQRVVCELYREGGVRGVELGSLAFPDADRPELVRLAVPRRTYWRAHLDHVADAAEAVVDRADELGGMELVEEPAIRELRHFSAELRPL